MAARSVLRNAHFFDGNDPTTALGGLYVTNGVTHANFYFMIEIILIFEGPFFLRDENGVSVQKDDLQLKPGNYFIIATGPIKTNNEAWMLRTISMSSGTRVAAFRNSVRTRDGRCVLSGEVAAHAPVIWVGFEAAHIFPLAHESRWEEMKLDRWITIKPSEGGSINSVQNGLLLESAVHQLFDGCYISVNPDDNHKIVSFIADGKGLAGKHLDEQFLNNPNRPVDQLFRWHFRQSVLANMRGAGEPIFEVDFPSGSDMIGQVLNGPRAAERMEFELFNRLAVYRELV